MSSEIHVRMTNDRLAITAHNGGSVAVRAIFDRADDAPPFVSVEWEDTTGGMHITQSAYLEQGEVKALRDRLDEMLVEMGD
jgi:hypothetical protein